jgi:hypothetical protein
LLHYKSYWWTAVKVEFVGYAFKAGELIYFCCVGAILIDLYKITCHKNG